MSDQGGMEEIALLQVAAFLRRHRRKLIVGPLVGMLGATAVTLVPRATYTSTASFVPQGRRGSGAAVAGIAAQFGLNVAAGEPSQSPAFYVELARSPQILASLVTWSPVDSNGSAGDSLSMELGVDALPPSERRDRAAKELARLVTASANARTGVVRVAVRLRDADIAFRTVSRLLALVNDFDVRTRRTQAKAERSFTELRLAESERALLDAENVLEAFLRRNRDYRGSPTLVFEHDRLDRQVSIRKEVVTTLTQANEQARIEAVRDTPVLTILESPSVPVRRDPRRLALKLVLGLLGGVGLGLLAGLGGDAVDGVRAAQRSGLMAVPTERGE
ncbi:MAG: hypothetical protein SFV24_22075 [Gemmatimonadales bacterium]|nr:hypothetical protein [Gemmatimonadales bacterium]